MGVIAKYSDSDTAENPVLGGTDVYGEGKFGQVGWSYDIVFPRFEAKGVDFAAANTRFANDALKSAQEATPSDLSDVDDERTWEYQQSFSIERAPGGLKMGELSKRRGEVAKELEAAEADWLDVSEQLETLAA